MKYLASVAALGAAFSGAPAFAAVAYDTSLAAPPGVYVGNTTDNVHYTVSTLNGTELGLSVTERYVGNTFTPDAGTATYRVPLGLTQVQNQRGANWGFIFSLNNGATGPTLAQVTTLLTVFDVANNTTTSFEAKLLGGNSYGALGKSANGVLVATDYAFQNSQALAFNNNNTGSYLDANYRYDQNNTFRITFSAQCTALCTNGVSDLGSVQMTVIQGAGAAVPEPAAWGLMLAGFGLVGGGLRARRRRTAVAFA